MSSLPVAFWAKVDKSSECWTWTAAIQSSGYGSFGPDLAHRLSYTDTHGPIADGLTVDHLCFNKTCVNPDHLEAVTQAENNRRARAARGWYEGGECSKGHPLEGDNLYHHPRGQLVCRTCSFGHYLDAKARRPLTDSGAVRAWAIASGLDVGARGRIPKTIRDAYAAAQQEVAA